MYNYLPSNFQESKSSFSILGFLFKLILFIIIVGIIIYFINYYIIIKQVNNLNDNTTILSNPTLNYNLGSKENIDDIDYSEEICNTYTSNSILDENTPEFGGVKCILNYILKFGNKINGQNKYELNYNSSNSKRYLLDLDEKIIHFYNENGLLNNNKICLFREQDNSGCILN